MAKRAAKLRSERARRRVAERTRRNAAALDAAVDIAENRPKRRYARTKTQLEVLASRGNITREHQRAGDRLARDYYHSNTIPTRLIGTYEANMPKPPKRYQAAAGAPGNIAARENFDKAMKAVGPWLSDILLHGAVLDLPVTEWGPLNGRAKSHGAGVLYTALDALVAHYGSHKRPMAA